MQQLSQPDKGGDAKNVRLMHANHSALKIHQ